MSGVADRRSTLDDGTRSRPRRVDHALFALWAAWAVNAIALFVNQLIFGGSGIGPGPSLGIVSLLIQAISFVFVARGSGVARGVTVVFLVLAALPLPLAVRLVRDGSILSAGYLAASFALKGVGVLWLFTADAKRWFAIEARGL
jgi:hypothetical protein